MLKRIKLYQIICKTVISFLLFMALTSAVFLFIQVPVFAQEPDIGMDYAENFDLVQTDRDIRVIIVEFVRYLITFLGIVAVSIIMYAGFLWMTSAGDESKIAKAKKTLTSAVIGLIIIVFAFAIVTFIINKINSGLVGTNSQGGGGSVSEISGLGISGNRIIESHYPARGQQDVPRNTSIVITFREQMDPSSIIEDTNSNGIYGDWNDNGDGVVDEGEYDKVLASSVMILQSAQIENLPNSDLLSTNFYVTTTDNKTFVFMQIAPYFGSPSEEINYSVILTQDINKLNGDIAFPGAGGGYEWSFEVSTFIDNTPPQITSIIPLSDSIQPRNVVIQVNFNEAINPISASGPTTFFDNIEVQDLTGGVFVGGNFYISNQYKTVEFLTEEACGVNSCGNTIYCLPADSNVMTLIKAATLVNIGSPAAGYPFDGVVDMVGNSLDGNGDETAQGPSEDNYSWSFVTSNNIDIDAPIIETISPVGNNISLTTVPEVEFNKILMSSSLTKNVLSESSGSIALYANPEESSVFFWITKLNDDVTGRTTVYINHRHFEEDAGYTPEFNSGVRDVYQNCYTPSAGPGCSTTPTNPYCCDGSPSTASCAP